MKRFLLVTGMAAIPAAMSDGWILKVGLICVNFYHAWITANIFSICCDCVSRMLSETQYVTDSRYWRNQGERSHVKIRHIRIFIPVSNSLTLYITILIVVRFYSRNWTNIDRVDQSSGMSRDFRVIFQLKTIRYWKYIIRGNYPLRMLMNYNLRDEFQFHLLKIIWIRVWTLCFTSVRGSLVALIAWYYILFI